MQLCDIVYRDKKQSEVIMFMMGMEGNAMDFSVGQIIKMKKQHPCGTNKWEILRVGMDFKLKCKGCDHEVMVTRKLVEKNFKGFIEE